jgi:biotin transporter BioY
MARLSRSIATREWAAATANLCCALGLHYFSDRENCFNCNRHRREVNWLARHKGTIIKTAIVTLISIPWLVSVSEWISGNWTARTTDIAVALGLVTFLIGGLVVYVVGTIRIFKRRRLTQSSRS